MHPAQHDHYAPAHTRPRRRRIATTAALTLASLPLTWLTVVGHASAATVDAQCLGTFVRDFTPPVTAATANVTAASTYSYSACLAGSTATGVAVTTLPLSCLTITAGPPETETIAWNDPARDTSTVAWNQPVIVGQTVVFTGTVTAGLYQGAAAARTTSGTSYLGSVLPCLLGGTPIAQTTGLVDDLTITG